ncbi:tetratricopeptide repeat protein [Acidaminobacter sp. JC074]|uniref:tetratricopeptide repeat protein n=1 Tax=Acidaminobacter sp. JC074 TaxID=2530199 RepID=UPI001F0FCFAD|nr:tetratricopeptide repeat protein [Acidaminobacter sp. JC074]MCH4887911.1 tetratricopeptide repeat protein [Acidaminobacter sp. JC074]
MKFDFELPCDEKLEFTDREDARELFWTTYEHMLTEIKNGNSSYQVLDYYGIGGVGKSRLQQHFMGELDKRKESVYVHHDLQESSDRLTVMRLLSNQLRKHGVKFLFYDYARYRRAELIGDGAELTEKQTIIESNPFLSEVFDICSCIPVISDITDPTKYIVDGIGKIRHRFNENKTTLQRIDHMTVGELYESLPLFFAFDISKSMVEMNRLLLVFLDTYEAFVNYTSLLDDALSKDKWLRDVRFGLIPKTQNILWVIGGRNELRWRDMHRYWDEEARLKTMNIGDLSEEDTFKLLESKKITNEKMKKFIYDLSNGTPLYLELCIDNYKDSLTINNREPSLEEVGENKASLVERYVMYRNNNERELLHILASFGSWSIEELETFKNKFYPNISDISLENIIYHSYVTKTEDGLFKLHDTVLDGILADYEGNIEKVKERVSEFRIDRMSAVSSAIPEELSVDRLIKLTRNKMVVIQELEDLEEYYNELKDHLLDLRKKMQFADSLSVLKLIMNKLEVVHPRSVLDAKIKIAYAKDLLDLGQYDQMISYAQEAYEIINDYEDSLEDKASIYNSYAWIISKNGLKERALEIAKKALKIRLELHGEEDEKTIISKHTVASLLSDNKYNKEAIKLNEEVYDYRLNNYGLEDEKTLATMNNLAIYYSIDNKKDMAFDLTEEVYAIRKKLYGEDHLSTLSALHNLSIRYSENGQEDKALECSKYVMVKRLELLGKKHPETIRAMYTYAARLLSDKKVDEAFKLYYEVIDLRIEVLGSSHPLTQTTYFFIKRQLKKYYGRDLSLAFENKYDYINQGNDYRVELYKKVFGLEHQETLKALRTHASKLMKIGNIEKARQIYEDIIDINKKLNDSNHEDVFVTQEEYLYNIWEYTKLEDDSKAYINLFKKMVKALGSQSKIVSDNIEKYSRVSMQNSYKDYHEDRYLIFQDILGDTHEKTIDAFIEYCGSRYDEELLIKVNQFVERLMKNKLEINHKLISAQYNLLDRFRSNNEAFAAIDKYMTYYKVIVGENSKQFVNVLLECATKLKNSGYIENANTLAQKYTALCSKNQFFIEVIAIDIQSRYLIQSEKINQALTLFDHYLNHVSDLHGIASYKYKKCFEIYIKLLTSNKLFDIAVQKIDNLLEHYDHQLGKDNDETIELFFNKAEIFMRMNELNDAYLVYVDIEKRTHHMEKYRRYLADYTGKCLMKLKRYEEAYNYFINYYNDYKKATVELAPRYVEELLECFLHLDKKEEEYRILKDYVEGVGRERGFLGLRDNLVRLALISIEQNDFDTANKYTEELSKNRLMWINDFTFIKQMINLYQVFLPEYLSKFGKSNVRYFEMQELLIDYQSFEGKEELKALEAAVKDTAEFYGQDDIKTVQYLIKLSSKYVELNKRRKVYKLFEKIISMPISKSKLTASIEGVYHMQAYLLTTRSAEKSSKLMKNYLEQIENSEWIKDKYVCKWVVLILAEIFEEQQALSRVLNLVQPKTLRVYDEVANNLISYKNISSRKVGIDSNLKKNKRLGKQILLKGLSECSCNIDTSSAERLVNLIHKFKGDIELCEAILPYINQVELDKEILIDFKGQMANHYIGKDIDKVFELSNEILELDENNSAAKVFISKYYSRVGQHGKALRVANDLLEYEKSQKTPENEGMLIAMYNLSDIVLASGDNEKAESLKSQAFDLDQIKPLIEASKSNTKTYKGQWAYLNLKFISSKRKLVERPNIKKLIKTK